ncbi:daptomycin-sensing surface protein LiaX [Vagococcus elongatus]|uniref:Uncharacterized protein n=1 Tax=Vagococcus elongatus TaxID=180344 RepID=A0A430AZI5_9ENTE|nr:daptomycin-sensing surface protein LiaX [Vagococcus elongatus]RSU13497.1 hypothetical protein CBF29_04385 [Vagococcus elongatus]
MNERERVFELVKKGIITSEEALVLLENMATEKDEKSLDQEASKVKKNVHTFEYDQKEKTDQEKSDVEFFEDSDKVDQERLEKILDELATEANKASAELDAVNVALEELADKLKDKEEQIMVINTIEELETLEDEKIKEREILETELNELKQEVVELEVDKESLEEKLKAIRKEQFEESTEQWGQKFDIPEDWEKNFDEFGKKMGEAGDKFGKKMSEAGSQLGRFFRDTVKTVSETVNDNVEWKDINIKVPGMTSSSFQHEFYYPETTASILDVKLANGKVVFKTWESEDLKVESNIKLYGKMDADTPLEAFLERSQIDVTDEKISFQIPNKRIKADLVFYLPQRDYDHVSVKLLNGDVSFTEVQANDAFVKSTNGDMNFNKFRATMLEVKGVNGNVKVTESDILDFMADSVNGDFTLLSTIENIVVSNVNGDIRMTVKSEETKKIEVSLVNGAIKLALPTTIGIEGLAKTNTGSIRNRLTDFEVVRERKEKTNQMLQFRRLNPEKTTHVRLSTTTGTVYMKDTDQ